MKIYFAGSIRGGREDKEIYFEIIKHLQKYGTVLSEHVGSKELTSMGEDKSESFIYGRDINWIKESDVIIAEVSTSSLGVGYEISKAEDLGKRILCLYNKQKDKKLSSMISGNKNLLKKAYSNLEEALTFIDEFMRTLTVF